MENWSWPVFISTLQVLIVPTKMQRSVWAEAGAEDGLAGSVSEALFPFGNHANHDSVEKLDVVSTVIPARGRLGQEMVRN